MNEKSKLIYYSKAFFNMQRSLREAKGQNHPFAETVLVMRHPADKAKHVTVMGLQNAIRWCVQFHVPTWSSNTWRMCRAGYLMLLQNALHSQRILQTEFDELTALLREAKALQKSEREKKTSARRKKNVSFEQIEKIESYVEKKPFLRWGVALVIWLKAAIVTGLRPNEWRTASIVEDGERFILRTANFKHNEIRSYGPFREIDLTSLEPEWRLCVKKQLAIVNAWNSDGELEQHYRGCSALLLTLNKRLWPRRKANINLYTGRHQFSANAKASPGCSEAERAAMMGHKTTKTSRERYGRRAHGSVGLTPEVADKAVLQQIDTPAPGFFKPKNAAGTP